MFLGHCHLGIAFCYPEWSYLNCFNMFLFSFCKKNKKKAPLAYLITRVVGPELEVPDVTACVIFGGDVLVFVETTKSFKKVTSN